RISLGFQTVPSHESQVYCCCFGDWFFSTLCLRSRTGGFHFRKMRSQAAKTCCRGSSLREQEEYVLFPTLDVTPGSLPGQFTIAKPATPNQKAPPGYYQIRVYEDSADPLNWHVEYQDKGTWSSKEGERPLRTGIRNPDRDYRKRFTPKGKVTTTCWFVPYRTDLK